MSWLKYRLLNKYNREINRESDMIGNSKTREREVWIDAVKGLGILLMILGHMQIGPVIRNFIYSFHMPMFIIISGYLFRGGGDFINYCKRKVKGLLFPYLLMNIGALFTRWVFLKMTGCFTWEGAGGIAKMQLLIMLGGNSFYKGMLTFIESVGPMWFVPFLFCINIVYYLVSKIKWKSETFEMIGETILFIFMGYVGLYIGTQIAFLPWSIDAAMVGLICYHMGVLIKKLQLFEKKYTPVIWIVCGLVWLLLYQKLGGVAFATREYTYYPLCIIIAIAASFFIMYIVKVAEYRFKMKKALKPFAWVGENAIWILIIHAIEFTYIDWLAVLQEKCTNRFVAFVIYLFVILVCLFVLKFIKWLVFLVAQKIKIVYNSIW